MDDEDSYTFLDSVDAGDRAEVERLLIAGADPNEVTEWRWPPALQTAVANRDVEMAELLIQHGANVNAATDDGMTPLMLAAIGDSGDDFFNPPNVANNQDVTVRLVKLLFANGADVSAEMFWEEGEMRTAYAFAKEKQNQRVMALLQALTRWSRLARKARFAGRLAATLIRMMHEAAERIYRPGGIGFEVAAESFEATGKYQCQSDRKYVSQ